MSDASAPNAGGATPPPQSECGKGSFARFVARTNHAISGLRISIEECPDASQDRAAEAATTLGIVGGIVGLVVRRNLMCGVLAGLAGAVAGALASRYHVSVDWDPDRAFSPKPEGEAA